MKYFIKLTAILLLLFAGISAFAYFYWYLPKFDNKETSDISKANKDFIDKSFFIIVKKEANDIESYLEKHSFNTTRCFMIDMSIPSGKKRFFVYNLKKDSIELAGLVTHGSGSITGTDELFFSNEPGSSCTSLGRYKIGKSYIGRFGLAYKLYGLDKTNSKAFERFVVLHAHSCVPVGEVYPLPICPSLGCPTVAPGILQILSRYIDESGQPILLKIYK